MMPKFITLNNGSQMPVIGLGTSLTKPQDLKNTVKYAVSVGYRHIDCGAINDNEDIVGDAINDVISNGYVKRSDLFITSKLWSTFQSPEHVKEGLALSLRKLKLDYLDLFLIHWPFGLTYDGKDPKRDLSSSFDESIDYVDTWKVFEEIYKSGEVKAIGISNFNLLQLSRLLDYAQVIPAIHQIEFHPYLDQEKLLNFCKSKGIAVTSFSPFASPSRPWVVKSGIKLFDDPVLKQLAEKYKKSVGQVILRYLADRGTSVIPKSENPKRIQENLEIFDFLIDDRDLVKTKELDRHMRVVPYKGAFFVSHKYFPYDLSELLPI
uniref:aldo-keto reductase family 1 member B1-like n=1 Tax=Styela clava TaxID=7725 RepID=UPI0019395AF3|nr:aldo-keto reductase family 1 member B1-like [Styela clava]